MNTIIAIIYIFIAFLFLSYVDYKIAIEQGEFIQVLLKYWWVFPSMLIFGPMIWYGYRQIYNSANHDIWLTSLINSVIIYIAINFGIYLASNKLPTTYQFIALALNLVSIFIAAI